jgi:methane monooxygenase PmoA-like
MANLDFIRHRVIPAGLAAMVACAGSALLSAETKAGKGVQLVVKDADRRVDVLIDGQPFTSYIWPTTIKKPVLYPLRTASGTIVTRGFPLEPRPGERVDHPHHVGLWLNHGDVNGFDFWNNSDAIPAKDAAHYGTIVHRAIKSAKSGADKGVLQVTEDWTTPDGKTLLREDTTFVFRGGPGTRSIDRLTTLTALDQPVVFHDSKEGMIGMRVARQLEQPSDKAEIFTDASGKATPVAKLDNTGVTGLYTSSEGKTGDAVWATRAPWTMLSGTIGTEPITIAILDHPGNPTHPTYWHARGYGLFAANPFGAKAYTDGKEETNFTLQPKQSVTLRHRILILSGPVTKDQMAARYKAFTDEVK